jgi:hypothetical protein
MMLFLFKSFGILRPHFQNFELDLAGPAFIRTTDV